MIIAEYHPNNPIWPAVLRIRLVTTAGQDPSKPRYVWSANGAGNGAKDATINAGAMAPKGTYATLSSALAAVERRGWVVSDTDTASEMGRIGGKAKTAAKSAAARKNVAKARKAIDPAKQAAAVAESNRRRAKKD
jgi:hypothetical protein